MAAFCSSTSYLYARILSVIGAATGAPLIGASQGMRTAEPLGTAERMARRVLSSGFLPVISITMLGWLYAIQQYATLNWLAG
jgi:hypothetical protein